MKCHIDIVTGFLESGKTTLINSLIKQTTIKEERIVVIQLEEGNCNIKRYPESKIKIIEFTEGLDKLSSKINEAITLYKANKIIIEFNGTENINELLGYIYKEPLSKKVKLNCMYFICDINKINTYIRNMEDLIVPCIESSDLLVINNSQNANKEKRIIVKQLLENLNDKGHIIFNEDNLLLSKTLNESGLFSSLFFKKLYYKVKKVGNFK